MMQAPPQTLTNTEVPLQLLLFVDRRPAAREQVQQVRRYLTRLKAAYPFDLQIIDVSEQPYLAEHFRLVATPALVKISPEPRQVLAGGNLIVQLKMWWPRWQPLTTDFQTTDSKTTDSKTTDSKTTDSKIADLPVQSEPTSDQLSDPLGDLGSPANLPSMASEGVVASVSYATELLQLADEVFHLKQIQENLQAQLDFKEQVIAMLAHDLRNPLTAASIAVETLEIGSRQTREQAKPLTPQITAQLLKHARTQIRAIDRMITDILQTARGPNAELRIQPKKLDLGLLCREVMANLADRMQAKQQNLCVDIPSDLPPVYADAERIQQVLINLLDNAIKYTDVGGELSLSILHRTTQKVQVSIGDSGSGIPEESQAHVFEDYFRLKRDQAQEGYGLGLPLCQRIVRAHYGQIWVDSMPNRQGSCFHFTLPVYGIVL